MRGMKVSKNKCGCVYEVGDRERWIKMCPAHESEVQEIHQRWMREHLDKQEHKEKKHVG